MKKKVKCVRCESLDRKQQSKKIVYTKDGIPLCTVCMLEAAEEEEYFKHLEDRCLTEELYYEYGSGEEFD